MSLMWTLVAAFLYFEVGLITLLLLPLISCKRWHSVFKSRFMRLFAAYSSFYFKACIILLTLMVVEAVRSVYFQNKAYQKMKEDPHNVRPETDSFLLMRLFRAQRNLYISGFSLFLWFVLNRLVTLISDHARVTLSNEASLAQARSATEAAQRLISSNVDDSDADQERSDDLQKELIELKTKLKTEQEARRLAETDIATVKKQAHQTAAEYDRVSAECQKLQKQLAAVAGESGDKKSD